LAITSLGTDTDSYIKYELADGTATFTMGVDDSDADKFKISTTALGTSDRFVIDSGGFVGIANSSPVVQLHIGSTSITDSTSLIRLEDANSTCNFTADTGSPSCGSDLTLKKDISSLDTVSLLDKVSALNPVSYRWITEEETAPLQYGFIAQEVEAQFPDLVKENTWIDGTQRKFLNTGGLMPYAIGAIKELDIKVSSMTDLVEGENSFVGKLRTWLADINNGINKIFAKKVQTEELCLKKSDGTELCLTGDQLQQILGGTPASVVNPPAPEVPPEDPGESDPSPDEVIPPPQDNPVQNDEEPIL
jgi:hypothetical protein